MEPSQCNACWLNFMPAPMPLTESNKNCKCVSMLCHFGRYTSSPTLVYRIQKPLMSFPWEVLIRFQYRSYWRSFSRKFCFSSQVESIDAIVSKIKVSASCKAKLSSPLMLMVVKCLDWSCYFANWLSILVVNDSLIASLDISIFENWPSTARLGGLVLASYSNWYCSSSSWSKLLLYTCTVLVLILYQPDTRRAHHEQEHTPQHVAGSR